MVVVRFGLTRDDVGWPPFDNEGLWAEPLGDDRYRIDNTPWFVPQVSADDVVRALAGSDDQLWAVEHVARSGRHTIRVIARQDGPLRGRPTAIVDAFTPLGVRGEVHQHHGIVALDIPADADLPTMKRLLRRGEVEGRWDYEEGCVGSAWLAL